MLLTNKPYLGLVEVRRAGADVQGGAVLRDKQRHARVERGLQLVPIRLLVACRVKVEGVPSAEGYTYANISAILLNFGVLDRSTCIHKSCSA